MSNEEHLLTLVQIRELTGYGTTITAYQALRTKNVYPVGRRKNPSGGGDIGLYEPEAVHTALRARISKYQSDKARSEVA